MKFKWNFLVLWLFFRRGGVTVNGQNSELTLTAFINFANAESSEKVIHDDIHLN